MAKDFHPLLLPDTTNPGQVLCFDLGYTPNGTYAISGSDDFTARVWDLSQSDAPTASSAMVAAGPAQSFGV